MSNEALRQIFQEALKTGKSQPIKNDLQQTVERALATQVAQKVDAIRDQRRRAYEQQKNMLLA